MPDPMTVGVVVAATLRLAAEAVVKSAVGEAVKDAYAMLKGKLSAWAASDVDALERQPSSTARQAVIAETVDSLPPGDKDALAKLAQILASELEKHGPTVIGLDVERLKALQVELGNITVTSGTGVRIGDAEIAGTFKAGDISVGSSPGKR
jgi:hypothetical protein